MNKDTIKLNMDEFNLPAEKPMPCKPGRPSVADIIQKDKIAKLYALAEKLHVKIGGAKS